MRSSQNQLSILISIISSIFVIARPVYSNKWKLKWYKKWTNKKLHENWAQNKYLSSLWQRSARSSHRPRNDRGMRKNSSPRSRLDLEILISKPWKIPCPRKKLFKRSRNFLFERSRASPRPRNFLLMCLESCLDLIVVPRFFCFAPIEALLPIIMIIKILLSSGQ